MIQSEVMQNHLPSLLVFTTLTSSPDGSCWIDRVLLGVFLADTLKLSISPNDGTTS